MAIENIIGLTGVDAYTVKPNEGKAIDVYEERLKYVSGEIIGSPKKIAFASNDEALKKLDEWRFKQGFAGIVGIFGGSIFLAMSLDPKVDSSTRAVLLGTGIVTLRLGLGFLNSSRLHREAYDEVRKPSYRI